MKTAGALVPVSGWDRTGIIASTACAVHCTLLPMLAAAAPVLGLGAFVNERLEWTFVTMTAVIGLVGHGRAYWRDHRHVAPGLIFAAGFALVLVGRLLVRPPWLEPMALGVGGVMAALSHYANVRLCRCCVTCANAQSVKSLP
ncbi:MAG TPA: MerC domain-containing protein [Vicinamibacterales bacterium]|jgi:hypothetical protein